jgi:hypothetical protein
VLSTANALVAWAAVYLIFLRPRWVPDRRTHLMALVAPHLFRYLGLIAVYPALFPVRSLGFDESYLAQIAWGDFGSGLLALVALVALARRSRFAVAWVWLFNIVGLVDFANAGLSMTTRLAADPSAVGPLGWVLLTVYLPMLMVSHVALFFVLLQREREPQLHPALGRTGRLGDSHEQT